MITCSHWGLFLFGSNPEFEYDVFWYPDGYNIRCRDLPETAWGDHTKHTEVYWYDPETAVFVYPDA